MDRNSIALASFRAYIVALRKESVDRNKVTETEFFSIGQVALRKESVDRNQKLAPCFLLFKVALRKESVDRNRDDVSD